MSKPLFILPKIRPKPTPALRLPYFGQKDNQKRTFTPTPLPYTRKPIFKVPSQCKILIS